MESSLTALRLRDIPNRASLECELSVLLHHICCQRYEKVLIQSNPNSLSNSESRVAANSYFEVLGEKPPIKKLTEVN